MDWLDLLAVQRTLKSLLQETYIKDILKGMLRVSHISKSKETSQNGGQRPLSEGQQCSDKEEAGSGDWGT